MDDFREITIAVLIQYFTGQLHKHRINVENLMCNSAGIGEHGDVMDEIEKELGLMADYQDKLEMLDYFDAEIGRNKTILNV